MGNKFREDAEAKHIEINIYFPNRGFAETFKSIIGNVENNLRFKYRGIYSFKVELNSLSELKVNEINDKWVLSINTFLSKNDSINILDCNTFFIKTPTIATKEFYCEVKDKEIDKLTYKVYKTSKFSIIKPIQ